MEQFKELHKTVEQLRTSGLSTGEIKKVSGLLYPTCRNQSRGDSKSLGKQLSPNHEREGEPLSNVFYALSPSLPFFSSTSPFHCTSYPLYQGGGESGGGGGGGGVVSVL